MTKAFIKVVLAMMLMGGPCLYGQTSNRVWFVMWNGEPTPSSDVSAQNIATGGSGNAVAAGSAADFACQTNFSPFNSPYDIAVDTAMGKAYVLDNNRTSLTGAPEYIYSFNINGTPGQVAASAQIIYTMPVSPADTNAGEYPFIAGIALDPTNHYLYFDQIDSLTGTNSYIGRVSLASSDESDASSPVTNGPALETFYVGQLPGFGPIAIDSARIYMGAINAGGNNGLYAAPISGGGTFTELVTISTGDPTFASGMIQGVASDSRSNLIYYLTSDAAAGYLNENYNTNQNAIWSFNTASNTKTMIASGFSGQPDNIALDAANRRYYFTTGFDGTGDPATHTSTNYQAIYTGALGVTNAPTLFYTPQLTGQDTNLNAGKVAIQGIYVVDMAANLLPPVARTDYVSADTNLTITLPIVDLVANDSDPNGDSLGITAVSSASTNGGSVALSGVFVDYTPVANYRGSDQFTYTLTDSGGAQAQGTVDVSVVALGIPASNHLAVAAVPTGRLLLFNGAPGQSYMIQYVNSLPGQWSELSPYLPAGPSGVIEYNDLLTPLPPMRFYRLHSQ